MTTPDLAPSPRNDASLAVLVGQRIAEARRARGLNRNQLATRLQTSWAAVNRWEKGRTYPSRDSIVRIARVLAVSVDQLVRQDEQTAPATNEELAHLVQQSPHLGVSNEEIRWLESAPSTPPFSPRQSMGSCSRC